MSLAGAAAVLVFIRLTLGSPVPHLLLDPLMAMDAITNAKVLSL